MMLQCSPRNQAARDFRTGGNCWAYCTFSLLCAIVYILLIHPLITQHHIFRYKIWIVWNYYIYLASADMVNCCVVFGCCNTPSETVSLHKFTSDKHRRHIWARFLRRIRARWHLKESVFICSKHFFKVRHGIRQEPGVEGNCNSNHLHHC